MCVCGLCGGCVVVVWWSRWCSSGRLFDLVWVEWRSCVCGLCGVWLLHGVVVVWWLCGGRGGRDGAVVGGCSILCGQSGGGGWA